MGTSPAPPAAAHRVLLPAWKPLFTFDKRVLFLLIVAFLVLNNLLFRAYVLKDDVYYRSLGERIATDRIADILDARDSFAWLVYVLIPLMVLIRVSFTAICLNIGTLFSGHTIGFGKLWRIALIADVVLVIQSVFRTTLLIAMGDDTTTLNEIGFFNPGSLISFTGVPESAPWISYPLYVMNVFEILYWLVLSMGLHWTLKQSYGKSFGQVMASYGVGLLIWVVTVVFLSINYSPE